MKLLLHRITTATGEQWFGFIMLVFFFGCVCAGLIAITADHKIRCYYLETKRTDSGLAHMIKQDIDWGQDNIAFSSNSAANTLMVYSSLKQCAGNLSNLDGFQHVEQKQ